MRGRGGDSEQVACDPIDGDKCVLGVDLGHPPGEAGKSSYQAFCGR
jgi:hypothetical protein